MHSYKLEEVFKVSGVPTVTFVRPAEYDRLKVALRTPGRGVIVEGPSGIGKTTAVQRVIEENDLGTSVVKLSARRPADVERLRNEFLRNPAGTVILDDFHRLPSDLQLLVADLMKTLADDESTLAKFVAIGINRAGHSLMADAHDLAARVDTVVFEANSVDRINDVISKGETALNIQLATKSEIVDAAAGSFFLAQLLCRETCIEVGVLETQPKHMRIQTSLEGVKSRVLDSLEPKFEQIMQDFCLGKRKRTDGRAPYLTILKWLAESDSWSINLQRELAKHSNDRMSVGQVIDKGYLDQLLHGLPQAANMIHFDPRSNNLAIEDPQFAFFLRNMPWATFARKIGFLNSSVDRRYDFALSFAGSDRLFAKKLFEKLADEYEDAVFYDMNEQFRILGMDVEEYLKPIYRSEALIVVCVMGKDYPNRVWTRIESEQFRSRISKGEVVPIVVKGVNLSMFDTLDKIGHSEFDPAQDMDEQVDAIALSLHRKLQEIKYRI